LLAAHKQAGHASH